MTVCKMDAKTAPNIGMKEIYKKLRSPREKK
jgi:hypothetical protein